MSDIGQRDMEIGAMERMIADLLQQRDELAKAMENLLGDHDLVESRTTTSCLWCGRIYSKGVGHPAYCGDSHCLANQARAALKAAGWEG